MPQGPAGLAGPLWRAIAVFRIASLVYAAVLVVRNFPQYDHPVVGWVVLGIMAAWTAYTVYAFADPGRRGWPLLIADLVVVTGCLLATSWVESAARIGAGVPTLTATWVAGPALSWAVSGGKRRGAIAALVLAVGDLVVRGSIGLSGIQLTQSVFNGTVLLFLTGIAVGHVAKLAADAEERLAQAVELEAATRERERLARRIHDSVLQVLALVRRRGHEIGGAAAELGRLAGEQEAALRGLIGTGGDHRQDLTAGGVTDLRALLAPLASTDITVSAPATPVRLPGAAARELADAVVAALDNVRQHCGAQARAWVFVEEDEELVTATVRDEGPGIPEGRLAEAARDGRLGVAQSIRGRLRDLGGTATITSAPGEGTEVELRVRRSRLPNRD